MRRAATALFLLAAAPAQAQTANIGGAWGFQTAPHRDTGCTISGDAYLRPQAQTADAFDVTMHAREQCPDGRSWRADETCVARRAERTLRISCTLTHAVPFNYNADQFSLTIESANAMTGRLVDYGVWNAPVAWRRAPAPIA